MTRNIVGALAAFLLAVCASSGAFGAPADVETQIKTDYTKEENVIFTSAAWPKLLPADLYVPKGEGPWPAVLLIYGGSWTSSDHRWQMSGIARKLAKRGYVVMNASYRGTPEFRYPAPFEDMRAALRWLRSHAGEYHVDPNKVAAYGFSAGGYLAALIGTLDGPAEVRVQAVVAASAPSDLTLFADGKILPRFLGATYPLNPGLFRKASPVTYVSHDDPPFFIYQGTDDKTVSPENSRILHDALDRVGVRNELHWVKRRGHASMLLFNGAIEDQAIDFLDNVLRQKLKTGKNE